MKKLVLVTILGSILFTSCVSKKKYLTLETQYKNTSASLSKTELEKQELEDKLKGIEDRVSNYNAKIQSLSNSNVSLKELSDSRLQKHGDVVFSNEDKEQMKAALANVDQTELSNARTLKDTLNLLMSYNLKKNLEASFGENSENDDINVSIDETVVMITISDKLLFKSGSYKVNPKANGLLKRLADVINSEPALEVMVEGHTDAQTVKKGASIKDNWELSVERSTAVIRTLQDKFGVAPEKLIAAGRSSFVPLTENDTKEGRAKNRRTRIVILPNLDKFLALLSAEY
ncbi:MAG: chemotaxis protein MotB [Patiriisocius sp.]|jgi:chemotaxis protein MotB